jgi:hypothetical protein
MFMLWDYYAQNELMTYFTIRKEDSYEEQEEVNRSSADSVHGTEPDELGSIRG